MIAAILALLLVFDVIDPIVLALRCDFTVRCVDGGMDDTVCLGKRTCG